MTRIRTQQQQQEPQPGSDRMEYTAGQKFSTQTELANLQAQNLCKGAYVYAKSSFVKYSFAGACL